MSVLAAGNGHELWYLTRSSGIVALVLLTGTLVLGITSGGTFATRRWPQFLTQGLHRNVSLLAVLFVGVHVFTTVADSYVPISYVNAVMPFTSPYKRFWLGLGAIAFDLILALVLSSLIRHRLRQGTWRGIHWLAYACWPVALVHGMGTGTDATTTVLRWITLACVFAGATATVWRLGRGWPRRKAARTAAAILLLLGMALMGYGMDTGFRAAFVRIMSATPAAPAPADTVDSGAVQPPAPSPPAPQVAQAVVDVVPRTTSAPAAPRSPRASFEGPAPAPAGDDGVNADAVGTAPPAPTTTRPPTTTTTRPPTTTTTTVAPGTTTTTTDN